MAFLYRCRHALAALLGIWLLLATPLTVYADEAALTLKDVAEQQEKADQALRELEKKTVAGPADPYNRGTPRASLLALAKALKAGDYETAVHFLDLRNLPFSTEKIDAADLVRKLHIIAQRVMNIDLFELSDDPRGNLNDGLPSYRDRITSIKTKKGHVDILFQRVPRGDGVYIWKISNATVAKIPELYDEFGYGKVGDRLSTMFPHYVIAGFELWQLVMLAGLFAIAFVLSTLIAFVLRKLLARAYPDSRRAQKFVGGPLRFLLLIIMVRMSFDSISPSLYARALYESKTLLTLAVFWVALGVVDLIIYRFSLRMQRNGQQDAVLLLRPAATGLKLVVTAITILYWLDNLGYEVGTLLAGLGVGGIAVALAAQKSLENLIGSIMIYTSQPVHVGDFCRFGATLGTVEEIGLRSTKLRTLARSVVHIPNALFAAGEIENLTERDKILYRCRLRLPLETPPDKLRAVMQKIRQLIASQDYIDAESSRLRFIEFGQYAQELELFIYIKTREYVEYLEYREAINLSLMDVLAAEQVQLTLPAHITRVTANSAQPVAD